MSFIENFTFFGKRFLILFGSLSFVWFLGFCNFSILWLILFALMLLFYWDKLEEIRRKFNFGLCLSTNEVETLKQVEDLPNWVYFPDVERSEWVNKIIGRLWPQITRYLSKKIMNSVVPEFQKKFKALRIMNLEFGDTSPKIGGVKVYDVDNIKRDEIVMDVEVYLFSDTVIKAKFKEMTFGIKNFEFSGTLRVQITPFVPKVPFFAAATLAFVKLPKIRYELTELGAVLNLPGLRSILKEKIVSTISDLIVLPNRYPIKIFKDVNINKLLHPMPEGMVRIKIIEGKALKASDPDLFGKGKSDPYVIVRVGCVEFRTKVIYKNLNPTWNETFEFVIDSADVQSVDFEVFDKDQNEDDFLGRGSFDVKTIVDRGFIDTWAQLNDIDTGSIRLNFTWLRFSTDSNDFTAVDEGTDAANPLSVAFLYMHVDSAKGLRLLNNSEEPSLKAELSMGNQKKTTQVKKKTTNPVWNYYCHFTIQSLYSSSVTIEVKDDKSGKVIGKCSYRIQNLLNETKMENDAILRLDEVEKTDATIRVFFALRALLPSKKRASTFLNSPDLLLPKFFATDEEKQNMINEESNDTDDNQNNGSSTFKDENIERISVESLKTDSRSSFLPKIWIIMKHFDKTNTFSVTVDRVEGFSPDAPVYVKLHLHPKDNRHGKRRTKSISGSKNITFKEKFDFLVDRDSLKISVLQLDIKVDRKSVLKKNKRILRSKVDLIDFDTTETVTKCYPMELLQNYKGSETSSRISERPDTPV